MTDAHAVRHRELPRTFADERAAEVAVFGGMCGPVLDGACTPDGFAEVRIDREAATVTWPREAGLALGALCERLGTAQQGPHRPQQDADLSPGPRSAH